MANPKESTASTTATAPVAAPAATPAAPVELADVNLSVKFTKKEMKALRLAAIQADTKNAGNYVRALVCKALGLDVPKHLQDA